MLYRGLGFSWLPALPDFELRARKGPRNTMHKDRGVRIRGTLGDIDPLNMVAREREREKERERERQK